MKKFKGRESTVTAREAKNEIDRHDSLDCSTMYEFQFIYGIRDTYKRADVLNYLGY